MISNSILLVKTFSAKMSKVFIDRVRQKTFWENSKCLSKPQQISLFHAQNTMYSVRNFVEKQLKIKDFLFQNFAKFFGGGDLNSIEIQVGKIRKDLKRSKWLPSWFWRSKISDVQNRPKTSQNYNFSFFKHLNKLFPDFGDRPSDLNFFGV